MILWCLIVHAENLGQVGFSLRHFVEYHKLDGMDVNDRNKLKISPIPFVPYVSSNGSRPAYWHNSLIHYTHPPLLQAVA